MKTEQIMFQHANMPHGIGNGFMCDGWRKLSDNILQSENRVEPVMINYISDTQILQKVNGKFHSFDICTYSSLNYVCIFIYNFIYVVIV